MTDGDPVDPQPVTGFRRTRLAQERTFLAWVRSGLAAFAVGLGAGKVVPALTKGSAWPYEVLGIGFAVIGLVLVAYGFWRNRIVAAALERGEYADLNESVAGAITVAILLLGLAVCAVVLFG